MCVCVRHIQGNVCRVFKGSNSYGEIVIRYPSYLLSSQVLKKYDHALCFLFSLAFQQQRQYQQHQQEKQKQQRLVISITIAIITIYKDHNNAPIMLNVKCFWYRVENIMSIFMYMLYPYMCRNDGNFYLHVNSLEVNFHWILICSNVVLLNSSSFY